MNRLATSYLFISSFNISPNSQHDIKKYIIRIFNKTAHDCILIHIKKDMQNYSIILIVNYIK
jgi:hypothetical protein